MARAVELETYEAVAVAQQIIASANIDVQPTTAGQLSLDNVHVAPDGSVACDGRSGAPGVAEIGTLLAEMLPDERTTRVPGALRYTIARALSKVEAPPFESVAALSAALTRHEQGDCVAVLRNLFARSASNGPQPEPPVVAPHGARAAREAGASPQLLHQSKPPKQGAADVDRRRRTPSASTLRRLLRETDEELFSHLNRTAAAPEPAQPVRRRPATADTLISRSESTHDGTFNIAKWLVAVPVAMVIAFSVGYTFVAEVVHVARPVTSPLPPATSAAASDDASSTSSLVATPAPRTARRRRGEESSASGGTSRP